MKAPTLQIDRLLTERLILIPYTTQICKNLLNNDFTDLSKLGLSKGKSWPDDDVMETLPKIINNLSQVESPTGFESWMIIKNDTLEIIGDAGFKGFNYINKNADIGYGIIKEERRKGYAEEERKRISRDLHDDIGERLTNINMLSALGQQKINEPQEMSEYLKRISNEIQTSAEALDDIVWSIDSKNDSIEQVTAHMRRYAAEVFDAIGILYTIKIDEKSLPAKLAIGKRRDLFFVFKETINNIQKHAMATEVNVNIEAKENNLLMQVDDNGKGFDTNQPTHRNGLKNIQQRMQKWGGTCTVQSSPGKGAILKIILPVSTPSLKRGIWEWFKNR